MHFNSLYITKSIHYLLSVLTFDLEHFDTNLHVNWTKTREFCMYNEKAAIKLIMTCKINFTPTKQGHENESLKYLFQISILSSDGFWEKPQMAITSKCTPVVML